MFQRNKVSTALGTTQQALYGAATGYSVYNLFANAHVHKPDLGFCIPHTATTNSSHLTQGFGDACGILLLFMALNYLVTRTEENKKENDIKALSCAIQGIGTLLIVNLAGQAIARAGFAVAAWIDFAGDVIAYCQQSKKSPAEQNEQLKIMAMKLLGAVGMTLLAAACVIAPITAAAIGTAGTGLFVVALGCAVYDMIMGQLMTPQHVTSPNSHLRK